MASGSGPPQPPAPQPNVGEELRKLLRVTGFQPTVIPALQQPGQAPVFQPSELGQPSLPQPGQPPGSQNSGPLQPGLQQPGVQQIGQQQPGFQQPGFQQPGFQQPGFQQPGFQQPGFQQPGFQQPGPQNSGPSQPGPPPPSGQLPPPPPGLSTPAQGLQPPPGFGYPVPQQSGPAFPPPDYRPKSPWAERYGPLETEAWDAVFRRDNVQHSCFAPDHPRLHPVYYGNNIDPTNWGQFASGYDEDRFYYSDDLYKRVFHQTEGWQLGPLQCLLRFSDNRTIFGGHFEYPAEPGDAPEQIFEREMIRVNEDNWLPFFKKDRWFSTPAVEPILAQNSWSVDDPVIWKELRIALELANRMLIALITERHEFILTMLYGKLVPWKLAAQLLRVDMPEPERFAKVLLSPSFFRAKWAQLNPGQPCSMDEFSTLPVNEMIERINHFLSGQEWGLHPTDVAGTFHRASGITYPSQDYIILLNVTWLRSLIKGNITLAERCWLYFLQAKVILHELSHALAGVRRGMDAMPTLNFLRPFHNKTEAYVDFDGSAETGYYMEKMVFGGCIRTVTYGGDDAIPLQPYVTTWPFPDLTDAQKTLGRRAEGHPAFAAGALNALTLIPSTFASTLLSEQFWIDPRIPRKSDNYFHMTRLFNSQSYHDPNQSPNHYRAPVTLNMEEQLLASMARGQLHPVLHQMVTNWIERRALWKEARSGWYRAGQYEWFRSPWGLRAGRLTLNRFNEEYGRGFLSRSLYVCTFYATRLAHMFGWSKDQAMYTHELSKRPINWVYQALGFLMLAAIPIQLEDETRPDLVRNIDRQLVSSATMPNQSTKVVRDVVVNDFYPLEIHKSVFYDPLTKDGLEIETEKITHLHYLDHVKSMVLYWANSEKPISKPWVDEIGRVERKLRARRLQLMDLMPSPQLSRQQWAEDAWDFAIPEYQPRAVCQFVKATGQWVNAQALPPVIPPEHDPDA